MHVSMQRKKGYGWFEKRDWDIKRTRERPSLDLGCNRYVSVLCCNNFYSYIIKYYTIFIIAIFSDVISQKEVCQTNQSLWDLLSAQIQVPQYRPM